MTSILNTQWEYLPPMLTPSNSFSPLDDPAPTLAQLVRNSARSRAGSRLQSNQRVELARALMMGDLEYVAKLGEISGISSAPQLQTIRMVRDESENLLQSMPASKDVLSGGLHSTGEVPVSPSSTNSEDGDGQQPKSSRERPNSDLIAIALNPRPGTWLRSTRSGGLGHYTGQRRTVYDYDASTHDPREADIMIRGFPPKRESQLLPPVDETPIGVSTNKRPGQVGWKARLRLDSSHKQKWHRRMTRWRLALRKTAKKMDEYLHGVLHRENREP